MLSPTHATSFALATPGIRPIMNAKTNTIEIVFFILLPFQKLLVFSCRTLCAALFTAILLLKNWLFEITGSTLYQREKKSGVTIWLRFFQILV
jgi:hypothetical protein